MAEGKKERSLFWQTYGRKSSGKNEADLGNFSDEAFDDQMEAEGFNEE